ncbi:MAG: hypothetical protein LBO66_12265 [Deltaproteobacteria bacterium]|jgi:hypothetical protein|nr:hypothetical protein [Deltaproteobacteria bacterium]
MSDTNFASKNFDKPMRLIFSSSGGGEKPDGIHFPGQFKRVLKFQISGVPDGTMVSEVSIYLLQSMLYTGALPRPYDMVFNIDYAVLKRIGANPEEGEARDS